MRNFKGFQNFLGKGNYGPSKTNLFEVSIQPPRFVLANTSNTLGPSGQVELREWINDILSYDSIKKRGLFNAVEVLKLIENNNKNKIDAGYTILSLACIEIWCRKFLN